MMQIARKLLMQKSNLNLANDEDLSRIQPIAKFENDDCDPFDYGQFTENLNSKLYIIASNILCQIGKQFIPVEISVAEFCFANGITKHYHKILNQKIPKGLRYECQVQQMRHKIPVDVGMEKLDNGVIYRNVYAEIVEFLGSRPESILLCDDEKIEQNSSIVQLLNSQYKKQNKQSDNKFTIKVFGCKKLAQYFYYNSASASVKFVPELLPKLLLKSAYDSWVYNRCDHHRILECNFCSLDHCFKLAYAFIYTMAVINDLSLDHQIPKMNEINVFLGKIVSKYRK